ncbi:hypothetical protein MMC30_003022 [Trapelia coarctata]|nr:hypothetical protein [Trapelia coarctata]
MSTDPKPLSLLEEFDDFPYNPSLRIPPLQDPLPFTHSSRPSPLEPNAHVNDGTQHATAKLTSRRKALAGAKLIGDNEHSTPYEAAATEPNARLRGDVQEPRKKQKLDDLARTNDFVQLPKPPTKAKESKPIPYKPVPVLNELHEPPPSAALFPPIVPSAARGDESLPKIDPRLFPEFTICQTKEPYIPVATTDSLPKESDKEHFGPVKRATLRPRRKWTEEETQDLLQGVGTHGPGKWKKILNDKTLNFSKERTTVDLKDRYDDARPSYCIEIHVPLRYRTCRLNQAKDSMRYQSTHKPSCTPNMPTGLSNLTADEAEFDRESSRASPTPAPLPSLRILASSSTLSLGPPSLADDNNNPAFASVNTLRCWLPPTRTRRVINSEPKSPQPYRPHRTLPPRWTTEEDANLAKGYQKYGFKWTAIAKDSEMNLGHRTGSQIRDRFRLKFAELYSAAPPGPETRPSKKHKKPKAARTVSSSHSSVEGELEIRPEKGKEAESNGILRNGSKAPIFPLPLTFKHLWAESTETESTSEQQIHPEADTISERRREPWMEREAYSSEEEQSRHSSTAPEEGRHMGILGLLNDEEEELEGGKLPSFKYPYDDWDGDSVTLPPLLWEDMATRPIFEL